MAVSQKRVFVSGATGYVGRALIPALLERGHEVFGLARRRSHEQLPKGCRPVLADPLRSESYSDQIYNLDAFIHLVGAPNASSQQLREVDLKALEQAVVCAQQENVPHFIYISVAQPVPFRRSFVEVRAQCEEKIRATGVNATILRPWTIVGPGRRGPMLLVPLYWLALLVPSVRKLSQRLAPVSIDEMVQCLIAAIEQPASGVRVVDASGIRKPRFEQPARVAAAAAGAGR